MFSRINFNNRLSNFYFDYSFSESKNNLLEIFRNKMGFPSVFSNFAKILKQRKIKCLNSIFDFSAQQYFFRLFRFKNGSLISGGIIDGIGFLASWGSFCGNYKKLNVAKLGSDNRSHKVCKIQKKIAKDALILCQAAGNIALSADGLKWIRLGKCCRVIGGSGYAIEIIISAYEISRFINKMRKPRNCADSKRAFRQSILSIAWRVSLLAGSILGCVVMATGFPFYPGVANFFVFSGLLSGMLSLAYTIKNNGSKCSKTKLPSKSG